MKVIIVTSGSGDEFLLGTVANFDEATVLVERAEARFSEWEDAGFPDNPPEDWLPHFEGCDVYAYPENGEAPYIYTDGWEQI